MPVLAGRPKRLKTIEPRMNIFDPARKIELLQSLETIKFKQYI